MDPSQKPSPGTATLWIRLRWYVAGLVLLWVVLVALIEIAQQRLIQAQQETAMAQTQRQQALNALAEAETAKARLEANLRNFEALQSVKWVHEPDRLALLERLEQGVRGIPGGVVNWTMSPATMLAQAQDRHGQTVATLWGIPLRLQASHLHEQEWLSLLQFLQTPPPSRIRLDGCQWSLDRTYLNAQLIDSLGGSCSLTWLYVASDHDKGSKP